MTFPIFSEWTLVFQFGWILSPFLEFAEPLSIALYNVPTSQQNVFSILQYTKIKTISITSSLITLLRHHPHSYYSYLCFIFLKFSKNFKLTAFWSITFAFQPKDSFHSAIFAFSLTRWKYPRFFVLCLNFSVSIVSIALHLLFFPLRVQTIQSPLSLTITKLSFRVGEHTIVLCFFDSN